MDDVWIYMIRIFRKPSGFTIVELLLVILIIGILMGLTVPQLQKMAQRQSLRSFSDSFASDIRIAYEDARLGVQNDENDPVVAYQIVPYLSNGYAVQALQLSGSESVLLTNTFDQDTVIYISAWPDISDDGFGFRLPTGRLVVRDAETTIDEPITLILTHTRLEESVRVTIEPNGRILLEEYES